MKTTSQIAMIAVIFGVAVPAAAVFMPATRPWLDTVGLLTPLSAIGLLPAESAPDPGAEGQGGGRSGGAAVVAEPAAMQALRDVVSAIGTARGVQAVDLSFAVTGRITAITVRPGDRVAAGDVIAELDAEAAQLAVDRAKLVLEDTQKTIARLDQLAQSGTVTPLQRQDAELALRTAALSLQTAERDLADHRLLAPVSGYVGLIEPQIGDLVSSSTTISRIEDRSSLIIDFRVPERIAALIAVGDPVQATAISQSGDVIAGQISAVDNRVDQVSRSLRVQATVGNQDDSLRAGMAFQIDLAFVGAEFPAVDPLAIQWGAEGAFVWVVRDGKATRQPIRILQRNADAVLIDAALGPSDLVVIEGVQALRPGGDVTVTQAGS